MRRLASHSPWMFAVGFLLLLGAHHLLGFSATPVGGPAIRVQNPEVRPVLLLLHLGELADARLGAELRRVVDEREVLEIDLDLEALARRQGRVDPQSLASASFDSLLGRGIRPGERRLTVVFVGDATPVGFDLVDDWQQAGGQVGSLVLWRASGVQEFDLLGSHEMNGMLYSIEWAARLVAHDGLPHFGLLGPMPVESRMRKAIDRRRVRSQMESFRAPVLIVDDHFGSSAVVAREHARVLPQSQLRWLDADDAGGISLVEWLRQVSRAEVDTRETASEERKLAAQADLGRGEWVRARGRTLWLLLSLLVLGTFITEDLTSIAAGLLIADGRLSWAQGLGAVFCGIYFGDQSLYLIGRVARRSVVHRRPWKWFLRAADLDRAARWFQQRGLVAILLTRFIPGTRLPTYVAAGVVRAGYWRFAAYFFVAVALWTPLLVGFSASVGAEALDRLHDLRKGSLLVFVLLALSILILLRVFVPLCSDRGRRQLWAQWQRIRHWEFWPPALVYLPVFFRILAMSRRYGGLRTVTAVNPGMPAGGLMGESKADILDALGGPGGAVPSYARIPAGGAEGQRAAVEAWLDATRVRFPIVVKPDQGERGQGVVIVHDLAELDDVLVGSEMEWIVQEFVPGLEYGVFYVRQPGAECGRILSVNTKERLRLRGDGVHDLEHLIIHHPRAGILAEMHLRANADRLGDVLRAGEEVEIVEVGAHARGTVFRDARALITPELTASVEEISRRFEGFYFGRYDLRVPSEQSLREGRDLRILELNGLTSEAAHIYDPGCRLSEARRSLTEQWRIAFEIGDANVKAGLPAATWRQILSSWQQHRQQGQQRPLTP